MGAHAAAPLVAAEVTQEADAERRRVDKVAMRAGAERAAAGVETRAEEQRVARGAGGRCDASRRRGGQTILSRESAEGRGRDVGDGRKERALYGG